MPGRGDRVTQRLENFIYVERMVRRYARAALLTDGGSELGETEAHVHAVCLWIMPRPIRRRVDLNTSLRRWYAGAICYGLRSRRLRDEQHRRGWDGRRSS